MSEHTPTERIGQRLLNAREDLCDQVVLIRILAQQLSYDLTAECLGEEHMSPGVRDRLLRGIRVTAASIDRRLEGVVGVEGSGDEVSPGLEPSHPK